MYCYDCGDVITTENETEEHILLNAIGGKLYSKKIICIECNSKFGSNIDDTLAAQLNPISNLLNIKRDRGVPPNIKGRYKNRDILIEPGGRIKLFRPYLEKDENSFRIETSTEAQARKVLKGLKRNNPEIDIEEQLKNATKSKKYLEAVKVDMEFGGEETRRAICKMALNFYLLNEGSPEDIQHLIPYIKGCEDDAEIFFYYPHTETFYKDEKEILHTLILVGEPQHKHLYVYIELFNEFKMIIFINKNYQGQPIYSSYHYNVVTNEVVEFEEMVKIPFQQLKKYKSKNLDQKVFGVRLRQLFQRIDNITVARRINEITTSSIREMEDKYPRDKHPIITKEMTRFLADRVSKEFVLSFQHRLKF
ncbi:HNH endonuclease [Niallia taxi]|uniref:HNH endonuclease n=1 Tax=Niallia taxi TaxID=2499688 RepID=UPI0020403EDA|nr:HNH endonuclease [Niallia taxi]MCM3216747.1 HNH endonuclease [Niallia taxi]